MAKLYDHAVIYNGVFYPANTPIEVKEEKTEGKATNEESSVVEKPKKRGAK